MESRAMSSKMDLKSLTENSRQNLEPFQFLRLLELCHRNKQSDMTEYRCRPSNQVSFPVSNIRKVTVSDRVDIEFGFLGLYGVDAPLPQYLLESIHHPNQAALQSFLDIINHRQYQLLYVAWKTYHPIVQLEQGNTDYLNLLSTLSGTAVENKTRHLLAYSYLLTKPIRSVRGLELLLQHYLGKLPVTITPQITKWTELQETKGLSKQLHLGKNTILGNRVLENQTKIQVILGPMQQSKALHLLKSSNKKQAITQLIKKYLGTAIKYDLLIKFTTNPDQKITLGTTQTHLGWNSRLAHKQKNITSITHIVCFMVANKQKE